MRIQQSQCLFGMLPCQILPAVCQIRIGEVIICVSRPGICEEVELKDLDR